MKTKVNNVWFNFNEPIKKVIDDIPKRGKPQKIISSTIKTPILKNKGSYRNEKRQSIKKDKLIERRRASSCTLRSTEDSTRELKIKSPEKKRLNGSKIKAKKLIPKDLKIIKVNKNIDKSEVKERCKNENKEGQKNKNNNNNCKKNSSITPNKPKKSYFKKVQKYYSNVVKKYNKEKETVGILKEKELKDIFTPIPIVAKDKQGQKSGAMELFKKAEESAGALRKLEYDSYLNQVKDKNKILDKNKKKKNKMIDIGTVIDSYNDRHPNDPIKTYAESVCRTEETADTRKKSSRRASLVQRRNSIIKKYVYGKGKLTKEQLKLLDKPYVKDKFQHIDKVVRIQSIYRGFTERFIVQKFNKIKSRQCAIEMFVWLLHKFYMRHFAEKYLKVLEYEFVIPFLNIQNERNLSDQIKISLIHSAYDKTNFEGKDQLLENNIKSSK